jgi:hypothetical protein
MLNPASAPQTSASALLALRFGSGQPQFGDYPPGSLGKGQAGRSGAHDMGATNKQLAAEGVFQAVDTPGYRRWRQWMTTRGGG